MFYKVWLEHVIQCKWGEVGLIRHTSVTRKMVRKTAVMIRLRAKIPGYSGASFCIAGLDSALCDKSCDDRAASVLFGRAIMKV